jgi:hypothetical protein
MHVRVSACMTVTPGTPGSPLLRKPHWPTKRGPCPPEASRVRNSDRPLKDRTGSSGMRFKASRSGPALTNIRPYGTWLPCVFVTVGYRVTRTHLVDRRHGGRVLCPLLSPRACGWSGGRLLRGQVRPAHGTLSRADVILPEPVRSLLRSPLRPRRNFSAHYDQGSSYPAPYTSTFTVCRSPSRPRSSVRPGGTGPSGEPGRSLVRSLRQRGWAGQVDTTGAMRRGSPIRDYCLPSSGRGEAQAG